MKKQKKRVTEELAEVVVCIYAQQCVDIGMLCDWVS